MKAVIYETVPSKTSEKATLLQQKDTTFHQPSKIFMRWFCIYLLTCLKIFFSFPKLKLRHVSWNVTAHFHGGPKARKKCKNGRVLHLLHFHVFKRSSQPSSWTYKITKKARNTLLIQYHAGKNLEWSLSILFSQHNFPPGTGCEKDNSTFTCSCVSNQAFGLPQWEWGPQVKANIGNYVLKIGNIVPKQKCNEWGIVLHKWSLLWWKWASTVGLCAAVLLMIAGHNKGYSSVVLEDNTSFKVPSKTTGMWLWELYCTNLAQQKTLNS